MRPGVRPRHWRERTSRPQNRQPKRYVRLVVLFALLTGVFLGLLAYQPLVAQGSRTSYWEYSASGRMQEVQRADIDGDGVDELLVSDENGRLALLAADGQVMWSVDAPGNISTFTTLNANSPAGVRQIVLAGDGWLLSLDTRGQTIWQHIDELPAEGHGSIRADDTLSNFGLDNVVKVLPYDVDGDGSDEILALYDSGRLTAYGSSDGNEVWRYEPEETPATGTLPLILLDDFNGDGQDEIVLGLFTTRRFSQLLFLNEGVLQWQQAVSRRVTTLAKTDFPDLGPGIAAGTNFGQVNLYDSNGDLIWYRTVNRPITALAFAELAGNAILAVGTDAGSVITYNADGQRHWTNYLARDADRAVVKLLPTPGQTATGQSGMAVLLDSSSAGGELSDVLLLGNNGQTLLQLGSTDLPEITRLVDVNHDDHFELLLARFATLQLIGLGVGNSEYVEEWQYGLDAVPTATLLVDLDRDGEDEIVVGTEDGRLHALSSDRSIRWLHAAGDSITGLAALRTPLGIPPRIVVVRSLSASDQAATDGITNWLELRSAQGELTWEVPVDGTISALAVDEAGPGEQPAILVGTTDGRILIFDEEGHQVSNFQVAREGSPIGRILFLAGSGEEQERILASSGNALYTLSVIDGTTIALPFAELPEEISSIFVVEQPGGSELSLSLIIFTDTGLVHGLNRRGVEMSQWPWPYQQNEPTTQTIAASIGSIEAFQENATAFLSTTRSGRLLQISVVDNQPTLVWERDGLNGATALFWDDLDKDGRPDTGLVGTRSGKVFMFEQMNTAEPRQTLDLDLESAVVTLSLLRRTVSQSPDLLTVTENSLIRLYREEENRPPLLTQPEMTVEGGQLSASVSVTDVENDRVTVLLELYDPDTGVWKPVSEQVLETGNGPLFWPSISPFAASEQVNYRFRFDDGFYRGYVTPPDGPDAPIVPLFGNLAPLMLAVIGMGLVGGFIYFRQYSRSTSAKSRRFYRQIRQFPVDTLRLLETKYEEVEGSPDFLLQLASLARQDGDVHVAGMSDGLFLLANRPQAGLSIILRTLDDVAVSEEPWAPIEQRQALYKNAYALLEAPSITELTLLRPQLLEVLAKLDNTNEWSPVLDSLLPVLANLRDSERVDAVDDRLVYLNQAAVRLRELQEQLPEFSHDVERTLVRVIARRWSGLISAEMEDLRGRAELQITLKTKRVVPNTRTHVAMEVRNTGRAPAENIIASLDPDPAYQVLSPAQTIAFLPSGRSRQLRFLVEPKVEDRFRVALSVTYDDRNRPAKTQAFGDMVHLLPPVREFSPIANPYVPGTPLRRNSQLFFGREELFEFIREATLATAGRNVLMLVGQRRTGKTSALLRIQEYLPPHLIPVYIDCQALGVTPGMPALLEELAWQIADTLGERGIECTLPEHQAWEAEPTRLFQRTFLPYVRSLLPDEAIMLLVFDEFEAFESMVDDGLLPRTLFTYMRHLMQHSVGLSFVFVGTRRLEEMSTDYWSVLFNIALYRKIDFLSDQAATRLITEPVAPQLIYDDLAIDKILRVTAGHPYFLQLVCYTLVKRANHEATGYITISDVNEALDEMLRLGEVHFAYLWQRSSYTERALLTAAAHLADRNEPLFPEELIEYLQSYGVELDPAEVTTGLNRLVERDIMREVNEEGTTVYDLRIGLVGLWVAQNKSLSRLLAQTEL